METTNEHYGKEGQPGSTFQTNNEDAEFENPSVDPGFETSEEELDGLEDEREGDIDASKSISEMDEDQENDALNYKNDRENGAYNPKNI